jgi:hypothetical protein
MFLSPSIYVEIARLRQQDLVASIERQAPARAALARRRDGRRRGLIEQPTTGEPPPRRIPCPREASA